MSKKDGLKIEVKRFIVKCLAVYESPSEVAAAVKEIFEIEISRQRVECYDPTKVAGEGLSKELKDLFTETREKFEASEILPLSKKIVRIKELSKIFETYKSFENLGGAAEILMQIAKEEGGMFTNRKEVSGPNGGPIVTHSKTLEEWNKDAEARTNQAAEVMEMFEDNAN